MRDKETTAAVRYILECLKKPRPKLDMDKLAKSLGVTDHFPLETPVDPLNPVPALDEISRKRKKGKKS